MAKIQLIFKLKKSKIKFSFSYLKGVSDSTQTPTDNAQAVRNLFQTNCKKYTAGFLSYALSEMFTLRGFVVKQWEILIFLTKEEKAMCR